MNVEAALTWIVIRVRYGVCWALTGLLTTSVTNSAWLWQRGLWPGPGSLPTRSRRNRDDWASSAGTLRRAARSTPRPWGANTRSGCRARADEAAVASASPVCWRSPLLVPALYVVVRRLLEFVVLLGGGGRAKELEILVLPPEC